VRRAWLTALSVAGLAIAGCGGGGSADPAIGQSFAGYIKALNAHDGATVCQALLPAGTGKLRPPVAGETCAESVTASIGHSGPNGKWVSAKVIGAPAVDGNDQSATLRATVENSYRASLTIKSVNGGATKSQSSEVTLGKETETVKMRQTGGKWLLAEPDMTLFHAIGQR
jgi:hypothetical protein